MNKLNIVIVTYDWPPRNAISVHRPYSWAKYWSDLGHEITVLTSAKQAFDSPMDLKLPILRVRVVEVGFSGRNLFITEVLRIAKFRNVIKKWKLIVEQLFKVEIDPRASWRERAKNQALELAKHANIVVSTFGPSAAHLIAMDMKVANPSINWISDYRDLWSQSHVKTIPDRARNYMREQELTTVGKYADLITTVSRDMVSQLSDLFKRNVHYVPNGFDIAESEAKRRLLMPARLHPGPFRIVYTGMIYRGHRNPRPLLEALSRLHDEAKISPESISVDFYGNRVEEVEELAKNKKFAPFIRIMGHVPREKSIEAQRNAGFLLLLESSVPEARGVLTGKVFEYLVSGRPILCVGSRPDFEIGRLLQETKTGLVFEWDNNSDLPQLLLETMSGRGLLSHYNPNINKILEYSRERIAKNFIQLIEQSYSKISNSH